MNLNQRFTHSFIFEWKLLHSIDTIKWVICILHYQKRFTEKTTWMRACAWFLIQRSNRCHRQFRYQLSRSRSVLWSYFNYILRLYLFPIDSKLVFPRNDLFITCIFVCLTNSLYKKAPPPHTHTNTHTHRLGFWWFLETVLVKII